MLITIQLPCALNFLCLLALLRLARTTKALETDFSNADHSKNSRAQMALEARPTNPTNPHVIRSDFPPPADYQPQVCLAFLSCCGRTDLLQHTLAGAIRHMEEDEPDGFQYEIAWVDNGSGTENQQYILDNFQIDHALPLKENMGLAYGMNLLNFNLCTAPYILLLEEDWLYTDSTVAAQTPQRKRAISTAIALTEMDLFSFDNRIVMGAFLRSDRYNEFLTKPSIGDWTQKDIDISSVLKKKMRTNTCQPSSDNNVCEDDISEANVEGDPETNVVTVDFQIFCGETNLSAVKEAFGSYTNGSGLYKRKHLHDIGRMYGEPGDTFNFRYAEANYAFRAMQNYCHVAIRLDYDDYNMKLCKDIGGQFCTAAFNHIGAGRGTFPMDKASAKCVGMEWLFYGIPKFDVARKNLMSLDNADRCNEEEVQEFTNAQKVDSARHQEQVGKKNKHAFALESEQRKKMRDQAEIIKHYNPDAVRASNPIFKDMSDEQIYEYADNLVHRANSPHPIDGFWDSHGFPIIGMKK